MPSSYPLPPRDPLLLHRYKFFDVPPLGQGGYAIVKLAHWKKHDMDVAVKIVPKSVVEDKEKYLCVCPRFCLISLDLVHQEARGYPLRTGLFNKARDGGRWTMGGTEGVQSGIAEFCASRDRGGTPVAPGRRRWRLAVRSGDDRLLSVSLRCLG